MRTMSKRYFSITILVSGPLRAWGNVIATAFCPSFALNRACCLKHVTPQQSRLSLSRRAITKWPIGLAGIAEVSKPGPAFAKRQRVLGR